MIHCTYFTSVKQDLLSLIIRVLDQDKEGTESWSTWMRWDNIKAEVKFRKYLTYSGKEILLHLIVHQIRQVMQHHRYFNQASHNMFFYCRYPMLTYTWDPDRPWDRSLMSQTSSLQIFKVALLITRQQTFQCLVLSRSLNLKERGVKGLMKATLLREAEKPSGKNDFFKFRKYYYLIFYYFTFLNA